MKCEQHTVREKMMMHHSNNTKLLTVQTNDQKIANSKMTKNNNLQYVCRLYNQSKCNWKIMTFPKDFGGNLIISLTCCRSTLSWDKSILTSQLHTLSTLNLHFQRFGGGPYVSFRWLEVTAESHDRITPVSDPLTVVWNSAWSQCWRPQKGQH